MLSHGLTRIDADRSGRLHPPGLEGNAPRQVTLALAIRLQRKAAMFESHSRSKVEIACGEAEGKSGRLSQNRSLEGS